MPQSQPPVPPMSGASRSRRAISCLTNKADPLNDMSVEDARQVLNLVRRLEAADAANATQAQKDLVVSKFFDDREEAAKADVEFWGEAVKVETAAKKTADMAYYNKLAGEHDAEQARLPTDRREPFFVTLRSEIKLILDQRAALGRDNRAALESAVAADLAESTSGLTENTSEGRRFK